MPAFSLRWTDFSPRDVCVGFAVRNLSVRHGFLLLVRYFSDSYNSTHAPRPSIIRRMDTVPITDHSSTVTLLHQPSNKNLWNLRTRLIPPNKNVLSGYFPSASQKDLNAIGLKVHYGFQKSPKLFFVNSGHTLLYFLFKIHFNIILLSIPISSKWCLFFRTSLKNSIRICLLSHACSRLLGPIAMTKFGKEYAPWSSSLCSFLH